MRQNRLKIERWLQEKKGTGQEGEREWEKDWQVKEAEGQKSWK